MLNLFKHMNARNQYQAKEERPDEFRITFQQVRNKMSKTHYAEQYPAKQQNQKTPINMPPAGGNPFGFKLYQQTGINTLQGIQQAIIDTGDKSNGPPETPGTTSAAPIAIPLSRMPRPSFIFDIIQPVVFCNA